MPVHSIDTLGELEEVIASPKLTVVDFFAKWCGPCKQIAPMIQTLSGSRPNVNFVKVDVDEAQDAAIKYRVRAMPTFMLFKAGVVLKTFTGANFPLLESLVKQHDTAPAKAEKQQSEKGSKRDEGRKQKGKHAKKESNPAIKKGPRKARQE